ncbi:MAG: CNNM domain-containing protein, partial [Paramuribaculum sp.]|nr:CNNM domain-containing protein [Paramuribaculum sp.]
MSLTVWIVLAVVSLIFSALFSGTEIAYVTADRVRVELDVSRGGAMSRIIARFYKDSDFFISTILVGNNIMLVIYGMGAAYLIEDYWLESYHLNQAVLLILSTLISTGVILITGEFLPKSIFRINPNKSLRVFALPVYLFFIILYPVSLFTT